MKVFNFPGYTRGDKDEMGRPPVQSRAWYITMLAVSQAPSGPTAERSAQVNRLYNAVRSIMSTEGTGDTQDRFLKPEGGTFTLENAEVKVLKEIIDEFRKNVTGGGSDALVFLDELIANAPDHLKLVS
jgi:hypothetical protein